MSDLESGSQPKQQNVVGGRHGSPTVTVAMPFSNVVSVDTELREAVAELARLVARLASATDDAERELMRTAADELASRLQGA
jgi:hypothetical protein